MDATINLGPVTVGFYGIMIALGVSAAIVISAIEAKRRGQALEHLLNMLLFILPLGLIGARLYHVIDEWSFYSQNPALIIGGRGLGIFGAVIGGCIGLIFYTRWKRLSTLTWLDIVAPGLILAQAIGRWGNYFNQELYGYPTDLPWAIYIDPAHRLAGYETFSHFHPLFFYESLWNAIGCVLLLVIGRRLKNRLLNGELAFLYVIYYSVGRFFLEGFKIDVWTLNGIPTARWITGAAIVVSIVLMAYRRYRIANLYREDIID